MGAKYLSGGDGLKKALDDISRRMGGGSVEVGFMEGATYPDGTPVAAVAFWNEYGFPEQGQPPRPFFRSMIASDSPSWPDKLAKLAKLYNYDADRVFAVMGEYICGQLQKSINDLTSPPLAESTTEAKGFDKPLIETGHMISSVAYKVNDGDIVEPGDKFTVSGGKISRQRKT